MAIKIVQTTHCRMLVSSSWCECGLTWKAEPTPTRDVNRPAERDGTASANGGWLRGQVRPHGHISNQVWRASTCWHCSHLPSASNSIIGNISSNRTFGTSTGVSGFRPYARQAEHCTIHFWHRLSRKNQSSVLVSVFIDVRMWPNRDSTAYRV